MKQTVVITGASAGVGRATVRAFARHGADISLLARGEDGLDGARHDVEAEGRRALVLPPMWPMLTKLKQRPNGPNASSVRSTCGSTTRWSPSSRP